MAPLLFFLLLIFFWVAGIDCVRTLQGVTVKSGRSVTIPCIYDPKNKHRVKYLCKGGPRSSCITVVRSDSPQSEGEVSITDHPDRLLFTVTMRNLQEKDSGWYWCEVEISGGFSYSGFLYLTVTRDNPGVMTESWVSAARGGSVTIPCLYDQKYKHHVKYWCRGYIWSHCVTVVRSDSPQRRGEVSITDDPNQLLFTVAMRNLQEKDSGWYWCGVEINWNADIAAMLLLSVGKGSSAVPQKATTHTVATRKATSASFKPTTEILTSVAQQAAGWTSTTNYRRGSTVTVFPPDIFTLGVNEENYNSAGTPRTSSADSPAPSTLLVSLVILGILLMLPFVVMVTRILWNAQKKTQTRNRETDIKFIVIPTTDREDMVTYSTLVHNTEATQREVNKPTTDREDMVTYSTLVHNTEATQREVNKPTTDREDMVTYSTLVHKTPAGQSEVNKGSTDRRNESIYSTVVKKKIHTEL